MAWRCGCVDGCETGSHSKRRAKCPLSLSCILFLLRWVHSCTQSPEEDCTASLMWTSPKPCSSDSKIAYLTHVSFYLHNSLTANFSCWSIWNWECINLDWYSFFYSSPLFSHVASSNSHIWSFTPGRFQLGWECILFFKLKAISYCRLNMPPGTVI